MIVRISIVLIILSISFVSAQNQENESDYSFDLQSTLDQKLLIEVENGDTSVIRSLLRKGANVNTTTYEGVTPLMFAVIFGFYDVAQLLILYGADVNKTPYDGKTPLMVAAENEDIETGEMLILNKADLSQMDREGYTALHYAVINSNYYFVDMLMFYETDIEEQTKDGSSPLMLASYFGFTDIVELLIKNGVNIETKDDKGYTPLMVASQLGFTDIVRLLLDFGADTEIKNQQGHTALCFAVKNGNKEIVELLIDYGANYNITFNNGYNLIFLAEQNNHYEIKKYLIEKGIKKESGFHFNKINVNTGFNFSRRDVLYELSAGLTQTRLGLKTNLIYLKRLGYAPIIENEGNYLLQIYENRSLFGFNFEKEFNIIEITNLTKVGITLSASEMFSFGKYIAYDRKPKGKFVFSPSIGVFYRKGVLFTQIQYQYLSYGIKKFPVSRFSFTVGFDFEFKKDIVKEKTIIW